MSCFTECRFIECENYDGHTLPKDFDEVKGKIDNFEVRDDDVWITSYPRTGSNWLREMVWLICTDLNFEKAHKDMSFEGAVVIEFDSVHKSILKFSEEHRFSNDLSYLNGYNVIDTLNSTNEKRFIKTHLPWHLLPTQIKSGVTTPKILHIMRNPKQVVVSYYYMSSYLFPMYKGSLEDYVTLFMDGKVALGEYFNTVLSYWEQRHRPNVFILTYEDMHANLKGTIKRVADFMNKTISDERIEKLAKYLSFDEMKKKPAVNNDSMLECNEFIRKGKTDSYKEELTQEMIDKLDEWIDKKAKGTGLPYERK